MACFRSAAGRRVDRVSSTVAIGVDKRASPLTRAPGELALVVPQRRGTLRRVSLDYDTAMAFIASIPEGRWTTYGDVADAAGNRDAPRRIGEWLLESGGSIPLYWRVINSKGKVPGGFIASTPGLPANPVEARDRLGDEGVAFDGERASERCRYTVEEWRAAGCPSGADVVAARLLADVETFVEGQIANLPGRLEDLLELAGTETLLADAVAVNRAIIAHAPQDIPGHNRLGRAYQELGLIEHARAAFEAVIRLDPGNVIATKRLQELSRTDRGQGRRG
jgi:alkylated DNA nucleotide flippase Atl1